MKFIYSIFFVISFNVFSNEPAMLIGCDEKVELKIDELTMTDEEIVAAKDVYFNKLMAQLNGNCISSIVGSNEINSSNLNKGGTISGSSLPSNNQKISTTSSSLSTSSINNINKTVKKPPKQQTVLKCLNKYQNDDEFSMQLKEAISKTNDPNLKKDLIERFAKYNNIKPESIKC